MRPVKVLIDKYITAWIIAVSIMLVKGNTACIRVATNENKKNMSLLWE